MYRGFNLKDFPIVEDYYQKGKLNYDLRKKEVNKILQDYITPDGSINGSKLQENWFPQLECDVFISHSHKDEKNAITLTGVLNSLGLSCFVDSCIWGYSDELLKILDTKHCFNASSNTFDYNLRNFTTSHVHMMLSNALFRMIDNSECLIFMNSPNSIKVDDVISKTVSPWIYSEISTTQVIRKKKPNRELIKGETKKFSEQKNINEAISIEYDVNLSHLTKLEMSDFQKWIGKIQPDLQQHILDTLYNLFPLPKTKTFLHE